MFWNAILIIFVMAFGVQLYYYFRYFIPLAFYNKESPTTNNISVSVLIAVRNEVENLKQFLPLLLKQNYPDFELILINDNSEDGTLLYLNGCKDQRLKIINLDPNTVGKKAAVKAGIDHAKYNHLIFTDADCMPASENWLRSMASQFTEERKIILGYGKFFKRTGMLNKLIRFEGLINAIQYFSFALAGKPYMGVGRNMAYHKSIFKSSTSFSKYDKVLSGDDDLLINEMANSNNTAIALDFESHTLTQGKKNWKDYIYQKRRQLQAGVFYKQEDKMRLFFFGFSNLLFYISFLIFICLDIHSVMLLIMFIGKVLLQLFVLKKIMAKLGDEDLWLLTPALELIYLIQISLIGITTYIWKVDRWK